MIISLIAAVDLNGGIGIDNQIPWHLPADLARFKELTMGHHLIVGRKTFQSIGSALVGRQMIILTRNPDFVAADCLTAPNLEGALTLAENSGEGEVFIIGGAEVYQQALPLADRLYLTRVQAYLEADTFFPRIADDDWELVEQEFHPADQKNPYPHSYAQYCRTGCQ